MIDLTAFQINSTLDLSILLFIVGIFSYYFGKLIEEAKHTMDVKQVTYMAGIFFIFLFIIIPTLIVNEFSKYLIFINAGSSFLVFIFILETLLFVILTKKVQSYNLFKAEYEDIFKNNFVETMKLVNKKLSTDKTTKNRGFDKIINCLLLKNLSDNWLLIFSFTQLWGFINVLIISDNILFIFILFFYVFLGISNIATLYGSNHSGGYPHVRIELIDKSILIGKLMKIEEDYVNLRNGHKLYNINKDQIKLIFREEIPDLRKAREKIDKATDIATKVMDKVKGVKTTN